jgi:hypothetical protein
MATSRDLAKEQYWRGVIRRFEASGLGARRFCEREGLSEHRFYWWRRMLRRRDQDQARCLGSSGVGKPVRGKAGKPANSKPGKSVRGRAGKPVRGRTSHGEDSAFLAVGLPFSVGSPIEVVHPRGHVIRVPAIFDPSVLGRILATIDASAGVSGAQ